MAIDNTNYPGKGDVRFDFLHYRMVYLRELTARGLSVFQIATLHLCQSAEVVKMSQERLEEYFGQDPGDNWFTRIGGGK